MSVLDLTALEARAASYLDPPSPITRRIFPSLSYCPTCRWHRFKRCGKSQGGEIEYRRCPLCQSVYRVLATII